MLFVSIMCVVNRLDTSLDKWRLDWLDTWYERLTTCPTSHTDYNLECRDIISRGLARGTEEHI